MIVGNRTSKKIDSDIISFVSISILISIVIISCHFEGVDSLQRFSPKPKKNQTTREYEYYTPTLQSNITSTSTTRGPDPDYPLTTPTDKPVNGTSQSPNITSVTPFQTSVTTFRTTNTVPISTTPNGEGFLNKLFSGKRLTPMVMVGISIFVLLILTVIGLLISCYIRRSDGTKNNASDGDDSSTSSRNLTARSTMTARSGIESRLKPKKRNDLSGRGFSKASVNSEMSSNFKEIASAKTFPFSLSQANASLTDDTDFEVTFKKKG